MTKTGLTAQDLRNYLDYKAEVEGGKLAQRIHKLTDSDISALFHDHLEHEEDMQELVAEAVATYLRTRNQK